MSAITPAAKAEHIEAFVTAQTAPLGVQLWPTTDDSRYGRNFTLESVETITRHRRDASGALSQSEVVWTYQNGHERHFAYGERVLVGVYLREDLHCADVEWAEAPRPPNPFINRTPWPAPRPWRPAFVPPGAQPWRGARGLSTVAG